MQTPNIGATVEGVSKKAADFAQCSFNEVDGRTKLNTGVLRAGQTVRVRCAWDENNLKLNAVVR